MADVILQALGGWFGFGLYDFLDAKSLIQNSLASAAPQMATIGRKLSVSAPDAKTLDGGPYWPLGVPVILWRPLTNWQIYALFGVG
jgi:hypothetical protein